MKIVREEILFDVLSSKQTRIFRRIRQDIRDAIQRIVWPSGKSEFTIHPKGKANGVVPIKDAFVKHLLSLGWASQHAFRSDAVYKPGRFDAVYPVPDGKYFALEWETGNISSSHRSVNRLLLGMKRDQLIGGALVLPTRNLYRFLTDRVGNYEELEPYFELWRSIKLDSGLLLVIAVEHDSTDYTVPLIRKGTDGRALR